jgi:hypothetical protein
MAYSDFTMDMVRREFGITVRDRTLFDPIGDLVPSPWLRESLEKGAAPAFISEKARAEFVVAPILIECRERMQNRVNIFSGIRLDVDPERGLKGECDFILARTPSAKVLQWPLMLILEAKKHDIEEGASQCAAQLVGACRYNERDGRPLPFIYGCVTNGDLWLFLKLHGTELQVHPQILAINEISKVLWFLVECLNDVDQQTSDAA